MTDPEKFARLVKILTFSIIDLLLTLDYDFRAAVTLLERWLKQYQAQQTKGGRERRVQSREPEDLRALPVGEGGLSRSAVSAW